MKPAKELACKGSDITCGRVLTAVLIEGRWCARSYKVVKVGGTLRMTKCLDLALPISSSKSQFPTWACQILNGW